MAASRDRLTYQAQELAFHACERLMQATAVGAFQNQVISFRSGLGVTQNGNTGAAQVSWEHNSCCSAISNRFEKNESGAEDVPRITELDMEVLSNRLLLLGGTAFELPS